MSARTAVETTDTNEVVGGPGARFQVIKILGAGGMGEVCLARDTALQRMVAIKTIRRDLCSNDAVRKRVERECLLHARVGPHPNIVTLFDKLEADDRLYLVMEFVDGEVLQDRLLRAVGGGPRLTLGEALTITEQCLDALTRIHQHDIIHRDIKPSNILLSWDESRGICAKLMDFGIAYLDDKESDLSRLTHADGVGPGTPLYMSPEQIDSRRYGAVTPATDIYSIGVLLYEMVCGQPPFTGSFTEIFNGHLNSPVPPVSLEKHFELSGRLTTVLKRALAKEPENRFPSAVSFRKAVLEVYEALGPAASLTSGPPQGLNKAAHPLFGLPDAAARGVQAAPEVQRHDSHATTLPKFGPQSQFTRFRGESRKQMIFAWLGALAAALLLLVAVRVLTSWWTSSNEAAAEPLMSEEVSYQPVFGEEVAAVPVETPARVEIAGPPQAAAPEAPQAENLPPPLQTPLPDTTAPETAIRPDQIALVSQDIPPAVAGPLASTGIASVESAFLDDAAQTASAGEEAPFDAGSAADADDIVALGTVEVVAPADPVETPSAEVYVVQAGDTFIAIAQRFGLDREQLARWNQLKRPGVLKPGMELVLFEPAGLPDIGPIDWGAHPAPAQQKTLAGAPKRFGPAARPTPARTAGSERQTTEEEQPPVQRKGPRVQLIRD